MKNTAILIAAAIVAVAVVPQASAAYLVTGDKVQVDYGTDHPGGGFTGGPFKLTTLDRLSNISIQTFCLETDEFISPGPNSPYYVSIEPYAILGGSNTDANDTISLATAWLYRDWLDSPNAILGADSLTGSELNKAVQQAIWWLEQESLGVENAIAKAYVLAHGIQTVDNIVSQTGVAVVNLWANANFTGAKQSMLTCVPEPAAVAVWSVLGLLGLALVRRRNRT